MAKLKNPMELFVLLNKSNCRKCDEPTCLSFAASVFQGKRQPADCPALDPDIVARYQASAHETSNQTENYRENAIMDLKHEISKIDLKSAAFRLNEPFDKGRLTVKMLGKDVSVDIHGNLYSDIHLHAWVVVPLLSYVLGGKGITPTGQWVPLRELNGGMDWHRLFAQRCEKPMKRIADGYTELFADMLDIFAGTSAPVFHDSDIAIVLRPLPQLPVLICYWKPDEGMESELNIFFDATATENLNIESIYTIGAGLVSMFEKFSMRHGYKQS